MAQYKTICCDWIFFLFCFLTHLKHQRGVFTVNVWFTSCFKALSLRNGHKATTRCLPPVVEEDFTVKINVQKN